MASTYDIRRYAELHERLPRFAEVAARLVAELNLEKSGGRGPRAEGASDRVIRDYVRRRVLSPTERGAESEERGYYTFRHLVEFLAARVLLNDGWPLEKIAERNQDSSIEALLALIPGQPVENAALALARSFRGAGDEVMFHRRSMAVTPQLAEPAGPAYEQAARSRAELPMMMRRLTGAEGPPKVRRLAAIEFGEGLTLLIDRRRAERMTLAEAEAIGRAVTASLIDYQKLKNTKEP